MLAIAPADFQYHDTYFVVAHFPLCGWCREPSFAIFAATYYWLPKMDRIYVRRDSGKDPFLDVVLLA